LGRNYLMKHSVGGMFPITGLLKKAAHAPSVPGAYVLLIGLAAPVEIALSGKSKATLCAGRYLYCGSAKELGVFVVQGRRCSGRYDDADR
jgi:hypothetical protein